MTPTREYGHLRVEKPAELTRGPDKIVDKSYGWVHRNRGLKTQLHAEAKKVYSLCQYMSDWPEDQLEANQKNGICWH